MDIRKFIANQNWIYAKTYAKSSPHEYCLLSRVFGSKEDFIEFVKVIKKYGFPAKFFGHPNTYFYIDGYFYWVMEEKIEKVDGINRCRVEDYDLSFYPLVQKKNKE